MGMAELTNEPHIFRVPPELVYRIRVAALEPSIVGFKTLVAEIKDYYGGISDCKAAKIANVIGYPRSFGLWFWEIGYMLIRFKPTVAETY